MPIQILRGDDADNTLYGGYGDEQLEGMGGNDLLIGQDGNDILIGGRGEDMLDGGAGNNTYVFNRGDGHDHAIVGNYYVAQHTTLQFGDDIGPADIVFERSYSDLVVHVGTGGDRIDLLGYFASGTMNGEINAPQRSVDIHFADGSSWDSTAMLSQMVLQAKGPLLQLGDIDDFFYADGHAVDGGGGSDRLDGGYASDLLLGGAGDDTLLGNDGDDVLRGGSGNDQIHGGNGDDVMAGGTGDDQLFVDGGFDTVVFGRGDGHDTVQALPWSNGLTIALGAELLPAAVVLTRHDTGSSIDLDIALVGSDDHLTIEGYYSSPHPITNLRFADGTVWTAGDIDQHAMTPPVPPITGSDGPDNLNGSWGDDVLIGGDGNDVLAGGGGNDVLLGGAGDDVLYGGPGHQVLDGGAGNDALLIFDGNYAVVFGRGAGADRLELAGAGSNSQIDIVLGADISAGDLMFTAVDGDSILLKIPSSGDSLLLARVLNYYDGSTHGAVSLRFADGTSWDMAAILREALSGDDGNNYLLGNPADNTFDGKGGDDMLVGLAGNDHLSGGNGNDTLDGGEGDDTLTGGTGDDQLLGGSGGDTYVFHRGDGMDVISDSADGNSIRFSGDIAPADVRIVRGPDAFYVKYGVDYGRIELRDIYNPGGTKVIIDNFVFADGTVLHASDLLVNIAPQLASPLPDVQSLAGQAFSMPVSAQTFFDPDFGDKISYSMTLEDGTPLPAWLSFDGTILSGTPAAAATLSLKLIATDLQGATGSDVFSLRIDAPPPPPNSAPTVKWAATDLRLPEGYSFGKAVPTFTDPDAGDVLTLAVTMGDGSPLPSWMAFDAANGWLTGVTNYQSSGVYAIKTTATDRAGLSVDSVFTITVDDVNRAPVLDHPLADATGMAGQAFSMPVSPLTFSDPDAGDTVSYSVAMSDGAPLPAWLSFDGMVLSGTPAAAATLSLKLIATDPHGAAASDFFSLRIDPAPIPNRAPTVQWSASDLRLPEGYSFGKAVPSFTDPDAGDALTLSVTMGDGSPLLSWMAFDAAQGWLTGVTSYQSSGVYAIKTTATDRAGLAVSSVFNITVDDVDRAPVLAHAIVDANAAEAQPFSLTLPLDTFNDPDGDALAWSASGLPSWMSFDAQTHTFSGTPADTDVGNIDVTVRAVDAGGLSVQDVFTVKVAQAAALTLTGTAGADVLSGMSNNDSLYGLAGDDQLSGNRGNDLLDGGSGADTMAGGAGNDRYVVDNAGDVVTESIGNGFDQVSSSIGYTLPTYVEMLTLTGSGLINGSGNADANVVQGNAAANTLNGMGGADILQGGGGNDILTGTAGAANVLDGGAGSDQLNGGSGNELFIGGAGNDTIASGGGRDIIVFGRGDGQDTVTAAAANNTLSLGHGILYADLTLRKSGNDLILSTGGSDQITFKSWYAGNNNHSVSTLQVVTEGGSDYQPGSANAINDNKVEQFNFTSLVAAFDAARSANASLVTWAMASSLAARSTGGSDSAAYGGDLAHEYALHGGLASIGAAPALAIVGSASFGSATQAFGTLTDGTPLLY